MTYPACYRSEMTGKQLKDILEDVADNIFHPDPYFQGGGDMVRVGGMGYSIDVSKPIHKRISNLTYLKDGLTDRSCAQIRRRWLGKRQSGRRKGPPIWEVVEKHLANVKTVNLKPNTSVKVTGA